MHANTTRQHDNKLLKLVQTKLNHINIKKHVQEYKQARNGVQDGMQQCMAVQVQIAKQTAGSEKSNLYLQVFQIVDNF